MAQTDSTTPPPEALFQLDLGDNGGVLAPRSVDELLAWIQQEVGAWAFMQQARGGGYLERLRLPLSRLAEATQHAQNAKQNLQNGQPAQSVRSQVDEAQRGIERAFVSGKWPHSSTAVGIRAKALSDIAPNVAAGYLFALSKDQQDVRFDPQDIASWHGFIEGLGERFGTLTVDGTTPPRIEALTRLQERAEKQIAEARDSLDQAQRDFEKFKLVGAEDLAEQVGRVAQFEVDAQMAHAAALEEHKKQIEAIRVAHAEGMKLRAPVDYWTSRQTHHEKQTGVHFKWALGSMAGLAAVMTVGAHQVWKYSENADKPAGWMLAVLGAVAVLGIWAVRLLVRIYLSHQHLATDAAERVTMAQTYLALVAEGKLEGADEDRRMVLQPLFRPAADGLVKDEGLPNPALEVLTRMGR
jgi:hypothetical protein